MQKELLEIEFRYNDRPIGSRPATSCSKTIAIGIFDTLEEDCWCGICEEHVELCTLSELWEMFGDIPVNNDDEIEEDFLNFPAGTLKIDVWHWFDERCPNNLHDDLMYPKNDAV